MGEWRVRLFTVLSLSFKKFRKPGKKKRGPKVPIDGGLGILMLGAAAFGAKKLRGANESNS